MSDHERDMKIARAAAMHGFKAAVQRGVVIWSEVSDGWEIRPGAAMRGVWEPTESDLFAIVNHAGDRRCLAEGCSFPQYNGEPLCKMHMRQGPCVWCGKTWNQHEVESGLEYLQRTPCLGMRGGFVNAERLKLVQRR